MVYLGASKGKGLCTERLGAKAMEDKSCCQVRSRKKNFCATNPVLLKYTVLPLALNLGVFSKYLQDLETHAVFSEMRVNRKHIHLKASLKYSWIRNLEYNS